MGQLSSGLFRTSLPRRQDVNWLERYAAVTRSLIVGGAPLREASIILTETVASAYPPASSVIYLESFALEYHKARIVVYR